MVDLGNRWKFLRASAGIYQELYVDPRTGLIRRNNTYRSWRRDGVERRQREQAEIAARRRTMDERTLLLLLDDVWYRVDVATMPQTRTVEHVVDGKPRRQTVADPRHDAVLRRNVSRLIDTDLQRCKYLYGSSDLYAVSKRQLSKQEIKEHRLR